MTNRIDRRAALLLTMLIAVCLHAQTPLPDTVLSGSWTALFNAPDRPARSVILHITSYPGGPSETYIDIPDKAVYGLRMDSTIVRDPFIRIVSTSERMVFEAMLHRDQRFMEGVWKKGGKDYAFTARTIARLGLRPQEPQEPVPYVRKVIRLLNREAGVILGGELVLPDSTHKWPVAILVSDGGMQDRNAETAGHKSFLVLADLLARKGIASLRLDDRGVGASATYGITTMEQKTSDLAVAVDMMRTHARIDPDKVFLVGLGEGGVLAAHAANVRLGVAGIVMLGTPAKNGWDHFIAQIREQEAQKRTPDSVVKVYVAMAKEWRKIIEQAPSLDSSVARIDRYHQALIASKGAAIGAYPRLRVFMKGDQRQFLTYTMMPRLLEVSELDLPTALPSIHCNVLALYAEHDAEVNAATNAAAVRAIKVREGTTVTVRTFPKMNHWFQTCMACTVEEMTMLNETFSPLVADAISEWLRQERRK